VPRDQVGTASGMNTTAARTGGAMGVALSATLFTYGLTAAELSSLQIESPQSWGTSPEIFVRSFNRTVHIVNFFTLLSVFFSAVCGLSQTPGQLIFFRAVQAIGGSMIAANGRAIVSVALPREERGKALGLTSTAFHVEFLTGPSLGSFLIDTIGWRWIFYINMPFSL